MLINQGRIYFEVSARQNVLWSAATQLFLLNCICSTVKYMVLNVKFNMIIFPYCSMPSAASLCIKWCLAREKEIVNGAVAEVQVITCLDKLVQQCWPCPAGTAALPPCVGGGNRGRSVGSDRAPGVVGLRSHFL